jgi:hypothetical protein
MDRQLGLLGLPRCRRHLRVVQVTGRASREGFEGSTVLVIQDEELF